MDRGKKSMRVLCRHGHYSFYPRTASDISRFASFYNQELVRVDDYYTFPFLKDLESYSLKGLAYKNLLAGVTFEGKPWEVMRENAFVYSLALKTLVPKASINFVLNPPKTGFYFTSETPMIQAGSLNALGIQLLSFDAEYQFDINKLRVRGFDYV
jgi:hypothetical protein